MRRSAWPIVISAVIAGTLWSATPAPAVDCAYNLTPFDIVGVVKAVGTTTDGHIYYSVSATRDPRCGTPKHYIIAVLPKSPVAACIAGRHARAHGIYNYGCIADANGEKPCVPELIDGYDPDVADQRATIECR